MVKKLENLIYSLAFIATISSGIHLFAPREEYIKNERVYLQAQPNRRGETLFTIPQRTEERESIASRQGYLNDPNFITYHRRALPGMLGMFGIPFLLQIYERHKQRKRSEKKKETRRNPAILPPQTPTPSDQKIKVPVDLVYTLLSREPALGREGRNPQPSNFGDRATYDA